MIQRGEKSVPIKSLLCQAGNLLAEYIPPPQLKRIGPIRILAKSPDKKLYFPVDDNQEETRPPPELKYQVCLTRIERQEFLAAKLKYDQCNYSVSALEGELDDLKTKIAAFGDLDSQCKSILDMKEKVISEAQDDKAKRLTDFSEELADATSDIRELQEAIDAGNAVLNGLQGVIASLKSAKNWGTWDMLGGGLIATAVKHSRIDDARASAHRAQQLLRRFQRELADVDSRSDIDIGSFATFADYFFDELIVDWVVQSRIGRSLDSATHVADQVRNTLRDLQENHAYVQEKADNISQKRRMLIESA